MYYTIQPHCLKADPWVLCSISIEFYPTFFDLSAFFPSDGFPQMLDETQVKAWFQNQQWWQQNGGRESFHIGGHAISDWIPASLFGGVYKKVWILGQVNKETGASRRFVGPPNKPAQTLQEGVDWL